MLPTGEDTLNYTYSVSYYSKIICSSDLRACHARLCTLLHSDYLISLYYLYLRRCSVSQIVSINQTNKTLLQDSKLNSVQLALLSASKFPDKEKKGFAVTQSFNLLWNLLNSRVLWFLKSIIHPHAQKRKATLFSSAYIQQ